MADSNQFAGGAKTSGASHGGADPFRPQASTGTGAAADAGKTPGELTDIAGEIASSAVNQGRQLLESAKGQATSFADQRKNDAAQSVADLAASLRDSGKTFEGRQNIQTFVSSAADGLEVLANGLRERSFAEIYDEAETYARERPVLVGAGAMLAGFMLARFIKSSAEEMSAANSSRATGTSGQARQGGQRAAAGGASRAM